MTDPIKRNDALEPCPFCGCGLARTVMDTGFSGVELMGAGTDHPYVWCGTCGASGSFEEDDNKAIAAWNARTLPALTSNPIADSKTANPVVNDPAAIPALQARIKALTEQLAAALQDADEAEAYAWELEQRLAKTVEALRFYSPQTVGGITFVGGDDAGKRAAAALAELEGK